MILFSLDFCENSFRILQDLCNKDFMSSFHLNNYEILKDLARSFTLRFL